MLKLWRDGPWSRRVGPRQRGHVGFQEAGEYLAVDPGFILSVRKKLALDQRETAETFGGGVNAFSRYENGKTRPPLALALVKLFKLLDRDPDMLSAVRTG